MPRVPVTVRRHAAATPEATFDAIVPIDLTTMMTGWGPFPAVVGTRDQQGPWDRAGSRRVALLSDRSETPEEIVAVERPGSFSYVVGPLSGPFGLIVARIEGRFAFDHAPGGGTDVTWTYTFVARRGRGLLMRAVAPLWRRYAQASLDRAVAVADAS